MTVARKSEIERQHREIVRMLELDERSGQTKLRQIPMQRDSFRAPEDIRQIRGRGADGSRDIHEPDGIG